MSIRVMPVVMMTLSVFYGAASMGAQSGEAAAVLDAQTARYRASVARDLQALDRLIADEMAYGHSNGSVDPKASYLKAVEGGRYKNFVPQGMKVDMYDRAAVVTGRLAVTAGTAGQEATVTFRIIDVYVRRADRWQLVHTQSTRIDPPPK